MKSLFARFTWIFLLIMGFSSSSFALSVTARTSPEVLQPQSSFTLSISAKHSFDEEKPLTDVLIVLENTENLEFLGANEPGAFDSDAMVWLVPDLFPGSGRTLQADFKIPENSDFLRPISVWVLPPDDSNANIESLEIPLQIQEKTIPETQENNEPEKVTIENNTEPETTAVINEETTTEAQNKAEKEEEKTTINGNILLSWNMPEIVAEDEPFTAILNVKTDLSTSLDELAIEIDTQNAPISLLETQTPVIFTNLPKNGLQNAALTFKVQPEARLLVGESLNITANVAKNSLSEEIFTNTATATTEPKGAILNISTTLAKNTNTSAELTFDLQNTGPSALSYSVWTIDAPADVTITSSSPYFDPNTNRWKLPSTLLQDQETSLTVHITKPLQSSAQITLNAVQSLQTIHETATSQSSITWLAESPNVNPQTEQNNTENTQISQNKETTPQTIQNTPQSLLRVFTKARPAVLKPNEETTIEFTLQNLSASTIADASLIITPKSGINYATSSVKINNTPQSDTADADAVEKLSDGTLFIELPALDSGKSLILSSIYIPTGTQNKPELEWELSSIEFGSQTGKTNLFVIGATVEETPEEKPEKICETSTFQWNTPQTPIPTDVLATDPTYEAFYTLWEKGIVTGKEDGSLFAPSNTLNRAEIATIMVRLLQETSGCVASTFHDVPTESWFGPSVMRISELGGISGYKTPEGALNGNFGPSDAVTFGQMAKIMTESVFNQSPTPATAHWASGYTNFQREQGVLPPSLQFEDNYERPLKRFELALWLANVMQAMPNL